MHRSKFSLSAAQLRLLALAFMLVDHLGRTLFPAQIGMVCLGRLAFPIFAFQAAEGYRHTHDFRRYCLRLAIFALISEIPFDLMVSGSVFDFGHQNVMLTLLLGLLCCRAWDSQNWPLLVFWFLVGTFTHCDYSSRGLLTVLMFHQFRDAKWIQLLFLSLINGLSYGLLSLQTFAVLAFIPISLYCGEKGQGGKWLQYGSYVFYPLHMLILGLL